MASWRKENIWYVKELTIRGLCSSQRQLTPPRMPAATTAVQCLLPADADLRCLYLRSLTPSALRCQTPLDLWRRHPLARVPSFSCRPRQLAATSAHSLHREQLHLSELMKVLLDPFLQTSAAL
ncbi:P-Selectin [Manis pentadactyla]|nr:P-Selectin [Manis pentadactyla]